MIPVVRPDVPFASVGAVGWKPRLLFHSFEVLQQEVCALQWKSNVAASTVHPSDCGFPCLIRFSMRTT